MQKNYSLRSPSNNSNRHNVRKSGKAFHPLCRTLHQNVTVKVIGVKDGKISLSMKALTADGEPEEPVEKFDYKETGEATTGLGALLKGLKF